MAGTPRHDAHGGLKADINVTPLVDVVLVLLIIFMVITPMLTRGKDVQLPPSRFGETQKTLGDPWVLSVTADKGVWLDLGRVKQAELVSTIGSRLRADPARGILIKADATVSVGDLRPILQTLRAAGATQISFAVLGEPGGAK